MALGSLSGSHYDSHTLVPLQSDWHRVLFGCETTYIVFSFIWRQQITLQPMSRVLFSADKALQMQRWFTCTPTDTPSRSHTGWLLSHPLWLFETNLTPASHQRKSHSSCTWSHPLCVSLLNLIMTFFLIQYLTEKKHSCWWGFISPAAYSMYWVYV